MVAVTVALLLSTGTFWTLHAASAEAGPLENAAVGTTTVCPSGCMYTSIQTALENSISGTLIMVGPGEYYEHIWMRGGVRIQGAGPDLSFIIWSEQAPAVAGYPTDLANAVLDGFTIVYNSSNSAIHIDGLHEKQIISNNVISNCVGGWRSGGILIADGATPTIINNVFFHNTLALGEAGGAIYVENAAPVITGNTFVGNSAKNGGAIAVYNEDTHKATITNNTFISNIAQLRGGAIYVDHASPSIRDNQIYSNTALLGGGICAANYSRGLIQGNQIAYNTALGAGSIGGGIAVFEASTPDMDSNVIRYNSAENGGGVCAYSASPDLTNNVLTGNHQAEILVHAASPSIANNTIVGTSSPNGIGIELRSWSSPSIANNIIAFEAYGILGDGTGLPTIRYNDAWMNSMANYSGVTTEPNNLNVNPGLRDAANGDYHLQGGSALIDAGAWGDAPPFDFEGDVRPMDGNGDGIVRPDIGADEYLTGHPTPTPTMYNLTIAVDPAEGGTTDPAVGVHSYAKGTVVGISAAPSGGYVFDHWEGAVADPNAASTTVTMNGDRTVTAHFAAGPRILGDVNGDDVADSTDALIILSSDVGVDTSQYCPMNCGDVNGDGLVNSTDALILLSYDVSITVPYPVGQPGCPSSVTPSPGCTP